MLFGMKIVNILAATFSNPNLKILKIINRVLPVEIISIVISMILTLILEKEEERKDTR
jgi:hypothetical protein